VAYLVAVVVGFAFGAADQYLGSRTVTLGPWAATAAQMSAPWLVLPFLIGITQQRARRAAALGLIVTMSALLGYFVLTCSPIEGVPIQRFTSAFVAVTTRGYYNPLFILGGLVTGPLFGLLGQRWRLRRSWISATFVAGALCLEPLARWTSGQLFGPAPVWTVEIASGAVVAALFAYSLLARMRVRAPVAP
jgi:hypothetical protein